MVERPRATLQWAVDMFGQIATDPIERAARLLEEAVELAQTQGLHHSTAAAIIERVFNRAPGNAVKEIGQVALTLEVLAENIGACVEAEAQREFDRVRSISKEEWQSRQNRKAAIGIASPCGDIATPAHADM